MPVPYQNQCLADSISMKNFHNSWCTINAENLHIQQLYCTFKTICLQVIKYIKEPNII